MSKIKFMTDSAADIPEELARAYDICVLPFSIAMGDREYRDCVDFDRREFYGQLLAQETIPTHSQITPFTFRETFEQFWQEGYTDLIYTCINAKASATFRNACMARDEFFEAHPEVTGQFAIYIIDSKQYTYAYGYPQVEGAKLAAQGADVQQVLALMQDWLDHVKILFGVYDLRFARKSGRVSAAAAILGGALGIKPIMTFTDGESKVCAKVRGEKNVIPTLVDMAKKEMEPGSPYLVIQGSLPQANDEVRTAAEAAFGYPSAQVFHIGGVIAINAGPGVAGVIFRKMDAE